MSAAPRGSARRAWGCRGRVLVVGVGVDDDVGAELEARVEPGLEAGGQALVVRQPDDVVDAVRARDLDRAVGRAVVDDEPLDLVEALDLARQVGERRGERLLLVEAGDLDDELHLARWGAEAVQRRWGRGRPHSLRAVRGPGCVPRADRGSQSGDTPRAARRSSVHVKRIAHRTARPAASARGPRRAPAAGALSLARSWPRSGWRAVARVLFVVPDVPELRLLLLAALGPRGAGRDAAELRRLPRADRAPAGDRVRRVLALSATPPTASWSLPRRVVRRRWRRAVPARARVVHAARRPRRRRAAAARASTSRSWPRAATSTSRTWRSWSGRRRSRPAAAARRCRCSLLLAGAGLLRPEAWLLSGLYCLWLGWLERGAGAHRAARRRSARWCGARRTDRHRRPAVLAHHTSDLAEELGRTARRSEVPRRR